MYNREYCIFCRYDIYIVLNYVHLAGFRESVQLKVICVL